MSNFSKFSSVKDKIKFLPVEINWTEVHPGKPVTAYTYYDEEKYCHVVVTPKIQCLFMHECGHIIFGHNTYSEQALKLAKELFKEKFEDLINSMNLEKIEPRDATIQYILNIAMDMEVNSQLFTLEEQEQVGKTVSEVFKRDSRPILPKDFGYPEKMNYIYYLSKMVQDNEIIKKLAEHELNAQKFAEMAARQLQNIKNRKKDVLPQGRYRSEISTPAAVSVIKKVIEKVAKEQKMTDGSSVFQVKTEPGEDYKTNQQNQLLNDEPEFSKITGENFSSLEKAFSHLIPRIVKTTRNDLLYNFNRRKHGNSGVLIGKRTENLTPKLPSVYILMDCSASMDGVILNNIVKTLKGVRLNKKSKVIFWDTKNCGKIAYSNIKKLEKFPLGGGTELASGIRYINSIKNINDILVVISDFWDDLEAIRTAILEGDNKNHLLIGWGIVNEQLKNFKEFNTYISEKKE